MADVVAPRAAIDPQVYSFRDPGSRVIVSDRVERRFEPVAAEAVGVFLASKAYTRLVAEGLIVEPVAIARHDDGSLTMEHEHIDNWNYPYEWSWSMLRDAALAHLRIQSICAEHDLGLSDATSFNITFVGPDPVFIDLGSFAPRAPDEPWWAYTDFCEHFLYPLMVSAYTGAELGPLLRGRLGRVSTGDAHALLRTHKRRRGVAKYVLLPHLAASRSDLSVADVSSSTASAMTPEIYSNILTGLEKLLTSMKQRSSKSTWSDYSGRDHYTDADLADKRSFVEEAVESTGAQTVLDVGANDGYFARVAAEHADAVVAVDADHLVVDSLYRSGPPANVLPLVVEATNPTSAMGWRSAERTSFGERIRPDLVLSLAVLHHISLSGNVPLSQVVAWLADMDADHVVELVHREDAKVQHLLSRKTDPDSFTYGLVAFEEAIAGTFEVVARQLLPSGTRTMFHITPARR